jgi:hypothetical protein
MSRTARPWKGAGPLALGGLLLSGAAIVADEPPSVPAQLLELGRQALDQGQPVDAAAFYRKALQLDPKNDEARRALAEPALVRIAFQNVGGLPTPTPPAPGTDTPPPNEAGAIDTPPTTEPPPPATDLAPPAEPDRPAAPTASLERASEMEKVQIQRLTSSTRERLQRARDLMNAEQADEAMTALRLALAEVQADDQVPASVRESLSREVRTAIQTTARRADELEARRLERLRLQSMATQRARTLSESQANQETVDAMMVQFDALMAQGIYNVLYNGGSGDIAASTAPFYDARLLAQQARAIEQQALAPRLGIMVAQNVGFLAQSLMFEELKEYRFMMTMQDVERAAVPFPDTITIEYPNADFFRQITEKRIKRYESVDLVNRDPKTLAILAKLNETTSMPFQNETPFSEVIKYIQTVTDTPQLPGGIPIYISPQGLVDAEKTMDSTVQINLEGVPLKTSLRLLLRQLGLTYTVKDGMMSIDSETSVDQPTEIRVYPVADLAIIPLSLLGGGGGGGMGGMGGGMGGMGGGMGGMGGGMGGMGGGMGGMGGGMGGMGGMGGGMRSVPVEDPARRAPFLEKKSN